MYQHLSVGAPAPAQLAKIVQQLIADATLVDAWTLRGGVSAQMTALEVRHGAGETRRVIVRQPNARTLQRNPAAAVNEFRILQHVQRAGVKAQAPLLLDTSGTILPTPYLVLEYVEGAPDYAPADPVAYARQVATQLARLHFRVNHQLDLAALPQQAPRLDAKIAARPATLDDTLQEGRIRDALEAAWPLPATVAPTLLHGDFWPGNLLWRAGELVAVIDWEDAELGDPLADFAITRLDMLWIMGRAAMDAFTATYRALTHVDFATLPYWDLVAALRPASQLEMWAADWPALGRDDITVASMRAHHRAFVDAAFAKIEEARDGAA